VEKFINAHFFELQVPKNLVYILHQLMRAHNLSINQLDSEFNERFAAGEKEINIKQLACILCIADSIEFSETRVVDGVLETIKEKINEAPSKEVVTSYREKHENIFA
jgi:cytochrome c-type biogenesis protein CcmH/NrfF